MEIRYSGSGAYALRKKIHVTAEHIVAGKRTSPTTCPVALALQEVLSFTVAIYSGMRWHKAEGIGSGSLSLRVERFIHAYDNRKPVKPFNFFTEVPEGETT